MRPRLFPKRTIADHTALFVTFAACIPRFCRKLETAFKFSTLQRYLILSIQYAPFRRFLTMFQINLPFLQGNSKPPITSGFQCPSRLPRNRCPTTDKRHWQAAARTRSGTDFPQHGAAKIRLSGQTSARFREQSVQSDRKSAQRSKITTPSNEKPLFPYNGRRAKPPTGTAVAPALMLPPPPQVLCEGRHKGKRPGGHTSARPHASHSPQTRRPAPPPQQPQASANAHLRAKQDNRSLPDFLSTFMYQPEEQQRTAIPFQKSAHTPPTPRNKTTTDSRKSKMTTWPPVCPPCTSPSAPQATRPQRRAQQTPPPASLFNS